MDHEFLDIPDHVEQDRVRTIDQLEMLQVKNMAFTISAAVGLLALIYIIALALYVLFPAHVGVN